jgi:hypothetical protein
MKRRNKPDLMAILTLLTVFGVLATGLVQGQIREARLPGVAMTAQR